MIFRVRIGLPNPLKAFSSSASFPSGLSRCWKGFLAPNTFLPQPPSQTNALSRLAIHTEKDGDFPGQELSGTGPRSCSPIPSTSFLLPVWYRGGAGGEPSRKRPSHPTDRAPELSPKVRVKPGPVWWQFPGWFLKIVEWAGKGTLSPLDEHFSLLDLGKQCLWNSHES